MWPIWLLDIDGVINGDPFGNPFRPGEVQRGGWNADQWIETNALGGNRWWKITAALPVISFLHKVHSEKWAEIVWLTTWQEDANNVSDALGLPHFRVITNPMYRNHRVVGKEWWKLAEAFKIISSGRPVIWTDDDIGREIRALVASYQIGTNASAIRDIGVDVPNRTLLISPRSSEGLHEKHLERIASFLGVDYDKGVL